MRKKYKLLNKEHVGYAITFEVIATLGILTLFVVMTMYILRVMNTQRYMNSICMSTAMMASKYGGTDTTAYRVNIDKNTSLLSKSQQELNTLAPGFNAVITGSPNHISRNGEEVIITIKYSLPKVFENVGTVNGLNSSYNMYSNNRNMSITYKINSVMKKGALLN